MCARRADREHIASAAHQQHLVVSEPADEFAAIGEIGKRDALGEIRFILTFSHSPSPFVIPSGRSLRWKDIAAVGTLLSIGPAAPPSCRAEPACTGPSGASNPSVEPMMASCK
jgi:hypothetical protein